MKQSTSNQKRKGTSHQNRQISTQSFISLAGLLVFFQFFSVSCADTQVSNTALDKQINQSTAVKLSEEDKAIIKKCQAQYDKSLSACFRMFGAGILYDYLDANQSKGKEKIQAIVYEEYRDLNPSIDEDFIKSLSENMQMFNRLELKEGELKTAIETFNRQFQSQQMQTSLSTLLEIRNKHLPSISAHYDKVAFVVMTNVWIACLDAVQHYREEDSTKYSSNLIGRPAMGVRGAVGFMSGYIGNSYSQYASIVNDTATLYENSRHYQERHSGNGTRGGNSPFQ